MRLFRFAHHGLKALPNLNREKQRHKSSCHMGQIWPCHRSFPAPKGRNITKPVIIADLVQRRNGLGSTGPADKTLSGDRMVEHNHPIDAEIWDKKEKELIAKGEDIVSEK